MTEKRTEIEKAVDELFEDPDSPDKVGKAPPPQTIANESSRDRDEGSHEIPYQR